MATTGTAQGVLPELRFEGQAIVTQLHFEGLEALTLTGSYDARVPLPDPGRANAHVMLDATFANVYGQPLQVRGYC